ncbi:MAG: Cell division protein FtsH, ATP-dependent zinc-metallo protease, partial [uncultured bacterium]
REAILNIHVKKVPVGTDVDLMSIARGTPGFCGADLANLVNEAALFAARLNRKSVIMEDFERAKDKILMGAERKSMLISDEEKKVTAYHEAGHTLVARMIPGTDPVHKVTIIPRGMALGLTQQLPEKDKYTQSKDYTEAQISILMGGRIAEELIFNQQTTGAGNDIERATELARKMVCEWGMSDKLGPLSFGKKEEQIFLGREISRNQDYSESTAVMIDDEVKNLVMKNYQRSKNLLSEHLKELHYLALALLEHEVLDSDQIARVIQGEKLPPVTKAPPPVAPVVQNNVTPQKENADVAFTPVPQPTKA